VAKFRKYFDKILFIPFIRLDQYLHSLDAICKVVDTCGAHALVYKFQILMCICCSQFIKISQSFIIQVFNPEV
jgi:hypothetical protein